MARFDVYRLPDRNAPFVIDVQSDFLSHIATRAVLPLGLKTEDRADRIPGLNPVIDVVGEEYICWTAELASVPSRVLRAPIANLESRYRLEITRALDFLFEGF